MYWAYFGYFIRAHESGIAQLIRRRDVFRHNFAENGLQDLKMA
jgi:hypothetical protein